jgi:hypothetical protein
MVTLTPTAAPTLPRDTAAAGHASARATGSIVYPLGIALILLEILGMIVVWIANRG